MTQKAPDLDAAYALETPEDSQRLYADWAETYDQTFAEASDYLLPQIVAEAFAKAGGRGPVLDVGAGTGLCAQALTAQGVSPIDGTDISQDMLDVAAGKQVYRKLIQGNILERLPMADDTYAGIVSSGTFTHGHVGPEGFNELLRVAAPGAQFCLSINERHFEADGFAAKFKALENRITDLALPRVQIYGEKGSEDHKGDTALIALFRKA
jgi:predicted TPR repeat methyltransferase